MQKVVEYGIKRCLRTGIWRVWARVDVFELEQVGCILPPCILSGVRHCLLDAPLLFVGSDYFAKN
jgi:hypothetical protein